MQKPLLLAVLLTVSAVFSVLGQTPRFATLDATPSISAIVFTNLDGTTFTNYSSSSSNVLNIAAAEMAEILTWRDYSLNSQLSYIRNGAIYSLVDWYHDQSPIFVPGPAQIILTASAFLGGSSTSSVHAGAYVALRIHPDAFPPDRTLVIGPGTNQVGVALECSSNLVDWSPATNGIYGGSENAKFFRIKAQRGP